MKYQTQRTAAASPKSRRKSETLTLSPAAALALKQVVSRFNAEEATLCKGKVKSDAHSMAHERRHFGNRLIEMASEALLDKEGSIHYGSAWWKLVLTQMSPEEIAARIAMIDAQFESIGGSLEPIDDATEAAAIQKLQAGKSTVGQSDPCEAEATEPIGWACCCEKEADKDKVLFALEMRPHGWLRIQEILKDSPEVQIVFRIERGEKRHFTGWHFATAQGLGD